MRYLTTVMLFILVGVFQTCQADAPAPPAAPQGGTGIIFGSPLYPPPSTGQGGTGIIFIATKP